MPSSEEAWVGKNQKQGRRSHHSLGLAKQETHPAEGVQALVWCLPPPVEAVLGRGGKDLGN